MSIATKSMKCELCNYETDTKCNFIRHCSSKSHRVNCGEVIAPKEKKITKKELALQQAALEVAAKVAAELAAKEALEQATRDEAARVLAEKVALDERMAST